MKRLLLVVAMFFCISILSAQPQTAYCDIYLRGGGLNLTATLAFDGNAYDYYERVTIGEIINKFAAHGWVLDHEIVIPRHPFFSMFTRHKLHLIMKKEYQEGEDPFTIFKDSSTNTQNDLYLNTDSDNIQVDVTIDNKHKIGDNIEHHGISAMIVNITKS